MPDTVDNCTEAIGKAIRAADRFIVVALHPNRDEKGPQVLKLLMERQFALQTALAALAIAEKAYLEEYDALQSNARSSWN